MDLRELKAGVADVEVTYKDRRFTVGYRPESVNEDDLEKIEACQGVNGVAFLTATVEPLKRLICRWDLTMGDDPLPVEEQSIRFLPPRMRVEILKAVMDDFFDQGNATPSDAGSPDRAASGGTARPTPDSSGTPNGLVSPPGTSPGSLTLVAP